MSDTHRSGCPINLSMEVLGDRWSLVILRDMIFGGKRHFRELLRSEEGISTNILADRLRALTKAGLITKSDDPSHKQKVLYSLTEMGIELVPLMAHLGAWGRRWLPVTEELSIRAELMEKGGPELWERFMAELRQQHLGHPATTSGPTVAETLRAAYEEVVARDDRGSAS